MNLPRRLSAALLSLCLLCPSALAGSGDPWYASAAALCQERGYLTADLPRQGDPLISQIDFLTMLSRTLGLYDDSGLSPSAARQGHVDALAEAGVLDPADFPVAH